MATTGLTRRGFVKLIGSTAALAYLPACGDDITFQSGLVLDAASWETIDLCTDILLPGARDAKAVRYIDTLLAMFDVDPVKAFAGGPYSGRTPFPAADGTASTSFPDNDFETFMPLSRVKDIAWRMRVFGSQLTPGGDFNDAVLGPTIGYRDLYASGLRALDAAADGIAKGKTFRQLGHDDQVLALNTAGADLPQFYNALLEHTIEGTFAAPEYGGNADLNGWKLARYDGDSAPLGHAQYVEATDQYVDRADQPTSGPSPGDQPETFDDDVIDLLTVAAIGSGGKRFF